MNKYYKLLKTWCDGVIKHEATDYGAPLCPSCKVIHGRSDNLIFPLLYLYKCESEKKYLNASEKLFDFQAELLCDDGSVYNDFNNAWRGITVFSAAGYAEALINFEDIIPEDFQNKIKKRLADMANWLYLNLNESYPSNINYQAANSAAMALCGEYFKNQNYTKRAARLMKYALSRFSDDGLLYGEGHPIDAVTAKGCRPIDIGYNVEESVPSLIKCAKILHDEEASNFLKDVLYKQLDFMLPDGAWDNSVGSRNYKWTYYGSRTSDGCVGSYTSFGKTEEVLFEAAKRNADLLLKTTHDGLLYGGPDYSKHGEKPCIHHTICHAVALCEALINGLCEDNAYIPLPTDNFTPHVKYFTELGAYRVIKKDYFCDIIGSDFISYKEQTRGGTLSLMYHRENGTYIAAGVSEYNLTEPINMQLTKGISTHRPLVPRIVFESNKALYSNSFDAKAEITCMCENETAVIRSQGSLCNIRGNYFESSEYTLKYEFLDSGIIISGTLSSSVKENAVFLLPLINEKALLKLSVGSCEESKIFFLTPGFYAREYRIKPNNNGEFEFYIS